MYLFVSQCISFQWAHRKTVFLSNSEARQRHTPRDWCGCPGWGRTQYGGDINHLHRRALSLANYLVSFFTSDWSIESPQDVWATFFAKVDPTIEAYGYMSTFIMGWAFLTLWFLRSLSMHVWTRKTSLTSGVGILSLCFSRAHLFPLVSSLECLGENKVWILLYLINTLSPA